MSKIYLVNVGANSQHYSSARSPLFADGTFVFVPFPCDGGPHVRPYPSRCQPFTSRTVDHTHDDPDWPNLTYGDDCANGRAGALKKVDEGDILLFWGMLWENKGSKWQDFNGERGWYLIGALRVSEILTGGQRPVDARPDHIARARRNVHFKKGPLCNTHRVFIGNPSYSSQLRKAIDLKVNEPDGLMYRTILTADGSPLVMGSRPHWRSSLRSCRQIWDLSVEEQRQRAQIVRDEIRMKNNNYDLLVDT
jgi:hypothetical protein